ncbi:hypothetical protein [Streptomyces sp. NPDC000878]
MAASPWCGCCHHQLHQVGIVLPSLGVDAASPALGLVELGRVRADVALRLAHTLRHGGPAV